jgi:hypothetical protein
MKTKYIPHTSHTPTQPYGYLPSHFPVFYFSKLQGCKSEKSKPMPYGFFHKNLEMLTLLSAKIFMEKGLLFSLIPEPD